MARLNRRLRVTPPADRGPAWTCFSAHAIERDKIFSERFSTRIRVRPQFEVALAAARLIKVHSLDCRVLFIVYGMKRLAGSPPN
ncbi:hypothetical protein [Kitasatospora sp. NBC_00070]|uniref:hypothetical protein n=1 Tax=Kitasatospora sp. NBC_00070 TaxID=2975962 RepID=UPI002F9074D0